MPQSAITTITKTTEQLIKYLLCPRHCIKHFTHITLFILTITLWWRCLIINFLKNRRETEVQRMNLAKTRASKWKKNQRQVYLIPKLKRKWVLSYIKKKSVGIIYLNKIMSFCYILHINLHKLHINLFLINLYAFQMYKEKEKTISFKKEK